MLPMGTKSREVLRGRPDHWRAKPRRRPRRPPTVRRVSPSVRMEIIADRLSRHRRSHARSTVKNRRRFRLCAELIVVHPASNFAPVAYRRWRTCVRSASLNTRPAEHSTYSIISSARANRSGDKVSPIKLAAFALIVSRKAVTYSTGRSEGFRPLRTLSTTAATCLFSI